ncbi:hypothetical protein IMZ38_01720 [Thermosphaera chiliense]|uniref:Uncharacterized protein n=1 Tax=Thermosphaera chiliense TaxID=3402707 RepID=A0A7M1UR03_9CREN|nr:hypothetical protein [Thermosphaera aggregans]QOR94680.1 hypothetical protein IMZ38_01720 [Thermosphaera aggregans]
MDRLGLKPFKHKDLSDDEENGLDAEGMRKPVSSEPVKQVFQNEQCLHTVQGERG